MEPRLPTMKVQILEKGNDRILSSIEFAVNPKIYRSFIPLQYITSANIPCGDFTLTMPDGSKKRMNTFILNVSVNTRDKSQVILKDFNFVGSDEFGAVLGTDFLSLFEYRIVDDKIYLVAPK